MFRFRFHPNSFLSLRRNVKPGLSARTKIIKILEKNSLSTNLISLKSELSYSSALYHLHLLKNENIVVCRGKRKYIWELTGKGQQKLIKNKEIAKTVSLIISILIYFVLVNISSNILDI